MNNNQYGNKSNVILNPDFVTGLTDAEGCFSVVRKKDNRAKFKINVGLRFQIKMLGNETELLNMVKLFFGCGVLYYSKDGFVSFAVQDFSSIKNKVIPHFLEYPLRGTKYLDFLSFKEAFEIINKKEHLFEEGINKFYIISKSMNSSRKFITSSNYSPTHTKENSYNYIPITGHYINGFIAGDGCLILHLGKNFGIMRLCITQHRNNRLLMDSIANFFKSPSNVYLGRPNNVQISLSGTQIWENVLFKHFDKYPLYGTKKLRLGKLLLIRELKKDNKHLIQVGRSRKWIPDYKLRIIEIWKS
jgi:LAGLIDADG endonuclease